MIFIFQILKSNGKLLQKSSLILIKILIIYQIYLPFIKRKF